MKFATATQVIILTVVSCLGLFALDRWKNPQLWQHSTEAAAPSGDKGPRLTLWMNHLCCTACLDDVRQALAAVPGVDVTNATTPKQLLTQAQANQQNTSLPDYGNSVGLPVTDIEKLDIVMVDRALRDKGLVAGRMELSGVDHFRLEAKLNHLCCGMCDRATSEAISFLKAKGAGGQFTWLDSLNVDHDNKTIVAYARYLQPGKSVDVNEFLRGLNAVGWAPNSVHVVAGEQMEHMGHQMSGD
jgi:hypothetical protein